MHRSAEPKAFDSRLVVWLVPLGDNDAKLVDFGRRLVGAYGLAQDRLAIQERVLLGQRPSKATSTASGDDQGGTGRHDR
jgi:hypothetical protein